MRDENDDLMARRALMAGLVAAGLAATAGCTQAQEGARKGATGFEPARHGIDAWLDQVRGTHRVFIDSASANGGAEALGYANNLFIATDRAYSHENADPAIVVCFRHFSTPFGYNDAMWEKYGDAFHSLIDFADPDTGAAPKINLMNSTTHKSLANRGATLDAMAAKGVQFAVCSMATQLVATVIARQRGGTADEIHAELEQNGIEGARFVSAGVMALTRSQEYGYSVLIAG